MICTNNINNLRSSVNAVSIALAKTDNGYHAGFFVKNVIDSEFVKKGFYLLHLSWHWSVRVDLFDATECFKKCYASIPIKSFNDNTSRILRAKCLGIMNTLKDPKQMHTARRVPYGIGMDGGGYNPDTYQWQGGAMGSGRTCATFLLEVLNLIGCNPIDFSTWQFSQDNVDWVNNFMIPELVSTLDRYRDESNSVDFDSYIENQREFGRRGIRYKPSEIAGALQQASDKLPVSFSDAIIQSDIIIKCLSDNAMGILS